MVTLVLADIRRFLADVLLGNVGSTPVPSAAQNPVGLALPPHLA